MEARRCFFTADSASLHDPFLLPDMEKATSTIAEQAIKHDEAVAVYGDYDVDGQTSTACSCAASVRWDCA